MLNNIGYLGVVADVSWTKLTTHSVQAISRASQQAIHDLVGYYRGRIHANRCFHMWKQMDQTKLAILHMQYSLLLYRDGTTSLAVNAVGWRFSNATKLRPVGTYIAVPLMNKVSAMSYLPTYY